MQLTVQKHRPTSVLRFMDNASQWSPHYKGNLTQTYSDLFNEKHLNALEDYSEIRKKYRWGSVIDQEFTKNNTVEEALERLENQISQEEINRLRSATHLLEEVHEKMLEGNQEKLNQQIKQINQTAEEYWQEAMKEIEQITDLEWKVNKINVLTYYSGTKGMGGNSNTSKNTVILSLGDKGLEADPRKPLDIIIHEQIHNIQQNNKKITRIMEDKVDRSNTVEEAIISCLTPNGAMSQELLGLEDQKAKYNKENGEKRSEYDHLVKNKINQLYPSVEDYYKNRDNRNFWKDFLPEVEKQLNQEL